ncbi:repressor LexA [Candidatus Beckwithbacteria bacterium CG10_big_fil_rev_8_21_14_0_10_34_10]|uniref:Repressor LexA n=1 Tax=Candidatus Beckwithbacteria bacterium CG10_big_fil_rev_8_21_14_0_10_34_10 TaxID=1974495 RepID=A0A2H0WCB9_9BACT|nr:MAG: repressor LexA [Candidatus Beckwithbacteria bacterium CG10_big_fil_rev_8_21_14_0_10_34_10]
MVNLKGLTEKQQKVLDIIISYIKTQGLPPTIREIKKLSEINSLRGVVLQLEALEKEGLIQRKSTARGIIVPSSLLIESNKKISIPLMACSIPAGHATDINDYSDEQIKVNLSQTKGLKNVFAVKVCGDSMIGENINDGDTAIIFPQLVANDGEIVAAKTENGVTLKKYRIVEGRSMLLPANLKYEPITKGFKIQGKLINILKK